MATDDDGARSTLTPTVRTAAATAARQAAAAQRAAVRLGVEQLEHLDDRYLIALAITLLGEIERRGLDPTRR